MEKGSVIFKHKPEDFIVEEVHNSGVCHVSKEGRVFKERIGDNILIKNDNSRPFLSCEMEKIGIDHFTSLSYIAKQLGRADYQIGYAGTKDKEAWTCQKITIFDPDLDKIKAFNHPQILLKNFKWEKHKLKLGDLKGNKFTIILRDVNSEALKVLNRVRNTKEVPNFFGMQRFGSLRGDNVLIGKLILKKKFQEAVFAFLTGYGHSESDEVKKAKKKLKQDKNISAAGQYFPDNLIVEHKIINYLSNNKGDWLGALKLIGRESLLIMCQSVQSRIFNEILERSVELRIPVKSIQLIGYDSQFSPGQIGNIEKDILESHALEFSDFNSSIEFLRLKKGERKAFFEVFDLDVKIEDDEIFVPGKKIILSFVLGPGNYATTFLENFFELRNI